MDDDNTEVVLDLSQKKRKKKKSNLCEPETLSDEYPYIYLLQRIYALHPPAPHAPRTSVPVPRMTHGGRRSTWTNFQAMCESLSRPQIHLMAYVCSELNTDVSIDADKKLVIKGRYDTRHIEAVVRKYIPLYVSCGVCNVLETEMERDPTTRLVFIVCCSCHSKRSVPLITGGYRASGRIERLNTRTL